MNANPEICSVSLSEPPQEAPVAAEDESGDDCPGEPARTISRADVRVRPVVWMVFAAFSFTLMGGMANALGSRCDWRLVVQARTLFSLCAAVSLVHMSGSRFVLTRPRILWVRSVAGTLSLFSTFYALTHLPVADVLTLTNTYPLWIVTIGFLAWGESVEGSILVAIVSAVFGVALIQQPHLGGDRLALAAALGAAVFTAVAMMGLNRLGGVDPRAVVAHFSGVAALTMLPLLVLGHPVDWSSLRSPLVVSLLLGVGITGTVGQIFLTKAYAVGAAPKMAVIGMSQVAMGLIFDVLYRRQFPPVLSLAGMTFVLAPVVWIILTGKARTGRRPGAIDPSPAPANRSISTPVPFANGAATSVGRQC